MIQIDLTQSNLDTVIKKIIKYLVDQNIYTAHFTQQITDVTGIQSIINMNHGVTYVSCKTDMYEIRFINDKTCMLITSGNTFCGGAENNISYHNMLRDRIMKQGFKLQDKHDAKTDRIVEANNNV